MIASSLLIALLPLAATVTAEVDLVRRAPTSTAVPRSTSARQPAASPTAGSSGGDGGVASLPLASLSRIASTTTSEVTQALPSTYAAGATPPVKGAPNLPSLAGFNPAVYPPLDRPPPTDTDFVKNAVSKINMAGIPNIAVNNLGDCANNTQAAANAAQNGWWTCGGHTRATDITFCPTKGVWGVSYDDGPSPYTPRLLNLLAQQSIKSTFFVVGSRVVSRPEMLQTEYMEGHQIAVHTWSHFYLTTLTNEQIVAEFAWSMKAIKDVTGVSPRYFRPPYGDMDDRVRYIAQQMGLIPIIWTSYQGNTFDTRDWTIGAGQTTAPQAYQNFENYFKQAVTSLTTGFIVLAHDLYQQSVDLAVGFVLPQAISQRQVQLQPIYQCLGEPIENAYLETSNDATQATETTATLPGASGSGFVPGVASTAGASNGGSGGSPGSGGSSAAISEHATSGLLALLVAAFSAVALELLRA